MKSAYTMSSVDGSNESDSETVAAAAEQTGEAALRPIASPRPIAPRASSAIGFRRGAYVLPPELVAEVFEYDDDASEARACCVAKGWASVRRGPPWVWRDGRGGRRRLHYCVLRRDYWRSAP